MAATPGWLACSCLALGCGSGFDAELGRTTEPSRAGCRASITPRDLQDPLGSSSGFAGQRVEVSGVVTLALRARERTGFFLQSATHDPDALGSEAVFVALDRAALPAPGTRVRVRAQVVDSAGVTELASIERLDECAAGEDPLEPAALDAPALADRERWLGMWVEARADWAVVGTARDGGVLASPSGRLYASGHSLGRATAPAELWSIEPAASDGPDAAGLLLPRVGSTLARIVGVVSGEGAARKLYTARSPAWSSRAPPAPVRTHAASLRVAALNLDNYFSDPSGLGARSAEELGRQQDKLVAALLALDADILALTEIENDGGASLERLITALDGELAPAQRYTFATVNPGAGATLRAALAFRPARVSARGEPWFDERPGFRRPPLFQAFEQNAARFTLGVVHFKSKRCDTAPLVVPREGCGEAERRSEATLLLDATEALAARSPPEPLLVVGDFNSDELEAPITALEAGGFVDLLGAVPAAERYSYVFEGRASLLDHALARDGFSALTERASIWHINADEPAQRGYALDNPPEAYAADPRRSSDHDPLVVDLRP